MLRELITGFMLLAAGGAGTNNMPHISNIYLAGIDKATVNIEGSNFLSTVHVDVRDTRIESDDIIGRYSSEQIRIVDLGGGRQQVSFDLRPLEAAVLRDQALNFYVINPPGNGSSQWASSNILLSISGNQRPYSAQKVLPLASGGSVYTVYDIGKYADAVRPTQTEINAIWYSANTINLKSVTGMYHIDPQVIDSQLKDMYNQGQRRIAVFVSGVLGVASNRLNSAGMYGPYMILHENEKGNIRLTPQCETNYCNLLSKIAGLGYEEVGIRFGTPKNPVSASWTNAAVRSYETSQDWEFISYYRNLTESILKPTGVKRFYDLSAERAGSWDGSGGWTNFEEYTETIWSNYWAECGSAYDTLGFSFATAPGRVNAMLAVYSRVGHFPAFYGFDAYSHLFRKLAFVRDELAQWGQEKKPIILDETYYNDAQNLRELDAARKVLGLNILYANQWPMRRDNEAPDYTENYPLDYCCTRSNFDSLNPDLSGYTPSSNLSISSVSGVYDPCTLLLGFHIAAFGLSTNTSVALIRSGTELTGEDVIALYDPSSFQNTSTYVQDGYIDLTPDRAAVDVIETVNYRAGLSPLSFVLLDPDSLHYPAQRTEVPFVGLPKPQITNVVRDGTRIQVWGNYFSPFPYINITDPQTGALLARYQGLDIYRVDQPGFNIIEIHLPDTMAQRLDSGPVNFYVVNQGATYTQGKSVFSPGYKF